MKPRALLSWSSGKDSAWTLHVVRQQAVYDVVGLVTTFRADVDRVAMHAVRRELVQQQAQACGLPLWAVSLPTPCTNADYESALADVVQRARGEAIGHFVFGDLFLEDIRAYRERQFAGSGVQPVFPLWTTADKTAALAREMHAAGVQATLTCVDSRQLDAGFVGRSWDAKLLADLPRSVDPCGERGEFHTFCQAGPMFTQPLPVTAGEIVVRDGFVFVDLFSPDRKKS